MWWLASEASICGEIPEATFGLIKRVNKLARLAHETSKTTMNFHPMFNNILVTWGYAAWAVRRNGSSQCGVLIGMADSELLAKTKTPVSLLVRRSEKLDRVPRPSLGREAQAPTHAKAEQE